MSHPWRRLLAPSRLWPLAALVAIGIIALAAVVTPAAEPPKAVNNPLVYANGEAVTDGHWSVVCIDGVAYLQILSPQGLSIVPKYRKNGLAERCDPPLWLARKPIHCPALTHTIGACPGRVFCCAPDSRCCWC
jgi:hypothetical protein